jgi:putative oxidoreductase
MSDVQAFFESIYIPVPMISAYVSVYAQFICGILFVLGLWVRPAAIIMAFNFTVAVIAANLDKGIEKSFAAWILFAVSVLFIFTGAGKISLDKTLNKS